MKVATEQRAYRYQANRLVDAAFLAQPNEKALAARNDIGIFGKLVKDIEPAEHHQVWIDAIDTGASNQTLQRVAGPNVDIASPRGAGKTTWFSAIASWIIGWNPGIRIILCSYSEKVAQSISIATKQIIESAPYQEIFPLIKTSPRWADSNWFIDRALANCPLQKDPTLLAVGMGGSIASRRADLIIIDDPIKSKEAIASRQAREDMRSFWTGVLLPCLVPGGRVIVPCTRYHTDDLHATNFNEEHGWTVINQKAILEVEGQEVSYWPGYFPLEELRSRREEDPTNFSAQYQNEPVSETDQIIKPEWIQRGTAPPRLNEIAIGIDLAASKKESADYSAIVVMGRHDDRYFALEMRRGRWTLHETINKVLETVENFRDRTNKLTVQIEAVAYQTAFRPELKRVALERGISIHCEDVRPKGDKEQRLRGISGLFETGKIYFDESQVFGELISELLHFGSAAHDDCVDGMIISLTKLYRSRKKLTGGTY